MSSCELSHFGCLSKGNECRSNPAPDECAAVNEPILSTTFAALFPAGVAAAELRGPGDASRLMPEEARDRRARRAEAHSRVCGRAPVRAARPGRARLASMSPFPSRQDRQPVWPSGVVGSITHTAGLCAAVVAESSRFAALGVDTEIAGAVKPELWQTICVADEMRGSVRLPPGERAAAVTCSSPPRKRSTSASIRCMGERLSFHDLWRDRPCDGAKAIAGASACGRSARSRYSSASAERSRCTGSYRFHEGFVSAGVAL